jgi:hypothetical protein
MSKEGWFLVHRAAKGKIFDQGIAIWMVFSWILFEVEYEAKNGLEPGQCRATYAGIAAATGLSVQNVRTALSKLDSQQATNRLLTGNEQVITLVNWATYQRLPKPANRGAARNQQPLIIERRMKNKEGLAPRMKPWEETDDE